MKSEDLHIREWGDLTDEYLGPAFIRKFEKGDILYGSRRTYLRKVAIAPFEGITSNTTFVIKADEKKINKKLLPFIMLSEGFANHSIKNSKGSVNPYVNWKDLANYEFLLPPKGQQAQIAELLWAMDEVVEGKVQIVENLSLLKKSKLKDVFNRKVCDKVKVGDISENLDNKRIPIAKSKRIKGTTPYYGASGIVDYVEGHTHDEPILLISEDGENLNSRKLPIAYEVDGKSWINNHAHVLRITRASRYLVKEYFNFADVSDYITGGTRPKITKGMLTVMPIYLPKSGLEAIAEHRLVSIDYSITSCKQYIMKAKSLQKSLINQIF